MRNFLLFILILPVVLNAQHYERYYDFRWNPCEPVAARFYTELDKKDSIWERKDYFIHERSLQMIGSYTDTSCKVADGHFEFYYANKNLQSIGSYKNGNKGGLWLNYHPNGMMLDSVEYINGKESGTSLGWHANGYLSDSAIWNIDGSGIRVSWFDNGNPSSAGRFSAGHKKNGKWQYFHKNGQLSSVEIYNNDALVDKQYFDEDGNGITDTTNKDKVAEFPGGNKAWQKYLLKNTYFPTQYKIENSDKAVVVVSAIIDEEGNVTQVEASTPFYPAFDEIAIKAVKNSPKWLPTIQHNRKIEYRFQQAIYFTQQ